MITEIYFKNYKLFNQEEGVTIPFKPVTVFVGPNGSGKSTVFKFMHFLSEKNWFLPVYVQYEESEAFFNFRIGFNNQWKFHNLDGKVAVFDSNTLLYAHKIEKLSRPNDNFDNITFQSQEKIWKKSWNLKYFSHEEFIDPIIQELYRYGYKNDLKPIFNFLAEHFPILTLKTYEEEELMRFNIGEGNLPYRYKQHAITMFLEPNFSQDEHSLSADQISLISIILDRWTDRIEKEVKERIEKDLQLFFKTKLSPPNYERLWQQPAIIMAYEHNSPHVHNSKTLTREEYLNSKKGQASMQKKKLTKKDFADLNIGVGYDILNIYNSQEDINRESQLERSDYNSYFENEINFSCNTIDNGAREIMGKNYIIDTDSSLRLFLRLNGKKIGIEELSFGEKKILAILFKAAIRSGTPLSSLENQSLAYFIEPEIGLHPAWQAKLANFFLKRGAIESAYSDGITLFNSEWTLNYEKIKLYNYVILETHSEYIVRGLQYEAMKAKRTEDVQIIYFDGKGGIIPIEINKDGTLSRPFGPGFYDESERLSLLLLDGLANKS